MKPLGARFVFVLFFFPFLTAAVGAERTNPNLENPTPQKESTESVPRVRRWHVGGNIGAGSAQYSGKLKSDINLYTQSYSGRRDASIYFDGFFGWTLSNQKTVIGPAISVFLDTYRATSISDLQVTTIFLSFMMQHFFSGEAGKGLFVRGDVGVVDTTLSDPSNSSYSSSTDRDYAGAGLRVAIGYAIPISEKWSIPVMAQWQYTSGRDDSQSNDFILTAGVIF
jgi:hypothetical protein